MSVKAYINDNRELVVLTEKKISDTAFESSATAYDVASTKQIGMAFAEYILERRNNNE